MEKVKGYIDHIIYQNRDNGYAVLSFITEGEELVCVGSFKNVESGETLEIEGDFVEHPVYGSQLKAAGLPMMRPAWRGIWGRVRSRGSVRPLRPGLSENSGRIPFESWRRSLSAFPR